MISDRVPDEIERLPEQHFRRFNRKDPEKGGCRKDTGGRDRIVLRNELISLRENWAQLQNDHLEKCGHAARVDHRSHHDRGIAAPPERHLGPAKVRQMTVEDKQALQEQRKGA